jgi:hypothetical protein
MLCERVASLGVVATSPQHSLHNFLIYLTIDPPHKAFKLRSPVMSLGKEARSSNVGMPLLIRTIHFGTLYSLS